MDKGVVVPPATPSTATAVPTAAATRFVHIFMRFQALEHCGLRGHTPLNRGRFAAASQVPRARSTTPRRARLLVAFELRLPQTRVREEPLEPPSVHAGFFRGAADVAARALEERAKIE